MDLADARAAGHFKWYYKNIKKLQNNIKNKNKQKLWLACGQSSLTECMEYRNDSALFVDRFVTFDTDMNDKLSNILVTKFIE